MTWHVRRHNFKQVTATRPQSFRTPISRFEENATDPASNYYPLRCSTLCLGSGLPLTSRRSRGAAINEVTYSPRAKVFVDLRGGRRRAKTPRLKWACRPTLRTEDDRPQTDVGPMAICYRKTLLFQQWPSSSQRLDASPKPGRATGRSTSDAGQAITPRQRRSCGSDSAGGTVLTRRSSGARRSTTPTRAGSLPSKGDLAVK